MSKQFKILISFLSDVEKEKDIIRTICEQIASERSDIDIVPFDFRVDVPPIFTGQSPQRTIDNRFNEFDCDIYLVILWKRIGDQMPIGMTPTENEFTKRYKRFLVKGKPICMVYFKNIDCQPQTQDDEKQLEGVAAFKKSLKERTLYGTFLNENDFRNKIRKHLCDVIDNFNKLTHRKPRRLLPINYRTSLHIARKVLSKKDYATDNISRYIKSENAPELADIVLSHQRIILLGDAGTGKTKELQNLCRLFSEQSSPFVPCLVDLAIYVDCGSPRFLDR